MFPKNRKKIIGKIRAGGKEFPLVSVEIISNPALPLVLLSAGIHGDEPAGVHALAEFLTQSVNAYAMKCNFVVLPCMNPVGFKRSTRENENGVDLNRNFLAEKPEEEVRAIKKCIAALRKKFLVAVDLHEDPTDSTEPGFNLKDNPRGMYLYEVSDTKERLGKKILAELRAEGFSSAAKKTIYGEAAENGAIWSSPSRTSPIWVGSFTDTYLPRFTRHTFVIETPTCWPLKKRINAHKKALSFILDAKVR